jgi:hypothetical protein
LGLGLGHGFGGCKEKKNEHQGDYYIWWWDFFHSLKQNIV